MHEVELPGFLGGFYVYLLWGVRGDRPLYVGKSENLFARLGAHALDPAKARRVRSITAIRCKDPYEMGQLERDLIAQYQPEFNVAGVKTRREAPALSNEPR